MKRKITLSMAMAALALAVHAQNWTAPTIKVSTDAIPDSAFLYHVGQQKFLTKGTTWGTHAALTEKANEALIYKFQEQETTPGVYRLYSPQAANTGLMGRSSEKDLFTDFNNQAAWSTEFVLNKVGQYYQIRTAPSSTNFGSAADETNQTNHNTFLMGWSSTNDDVNNSGASLGTNVGIFMLDPQNADNGEMQFDWGFVLMTDYNQYSAKLNLYNKLVEAAELGANTTAASAVYEDENASITDINQAIGNLNQQITDIKQGNASEDNPIDMTDQYLVNADFSQGNQNGWVVEGTSLVYNKDNKPNGDLNDNGLNNGETMTHSVAGWTSGANGGHLSDVKLSQVIENLPAGKYVFTGSIVGQHGVDMPVGIYLFANGVTESRIQVQHDANVWNDLVATQPNGKNPNQVFMHPELEIIHAGGPLTLGFMLENTNCNWVYAGKFRLICKGQTNMNAFALALQQTIDSSVAYEEEDAYIYSQTLRNQLTSQLDAARTTLGNGDSDEAMQQATSELRSLVSKIQAEMESYKQLKAQLQKLNQDIARYEGLESLHETLSNWKDTYEYAYEDRTISAADISTWIAGYEASIKEAITAAIPNATEAKPVEVTVLAKNMDFAQNSATEGWTVNAGNISGHGNYAVNFHTAEMWNNTFSALQSLENMPAGKYILKAKAFYRTSGNAEGYNAYIQNPNDKSSILTYLVIGDAKAPVVNHAAGARTATEAPYAGYAQTAEGSGIWLPNSMESAEWAFNQDDTYACEVHGYLTQDGTLTFGIRNDELQAGNAWSIWSQFRLFYCGTSVDALYEQLQNLINTASAKSEEIGTLNEAADAKLTAATTAAENVTVEAGEEAITAAMNELNAAIAYAEKGQELQKQVISLESAYQEKLNLGIESNDTRFEELLGEVSEAVSNETFVSNEKMQSWIDELPKAWTAYVQFNHLNATVEAPENITDVLVNPSFDQGTNDNNGATGWTREFKTDGGHVGIASADAQTKSNYTYEFWKVKEFKLFQSVVGLAEGYYRISANALYREGSHSNETVARYLTNRDEVNDVSLFANNKSVKIANLYDEMYEGSTGAEGERTATVNGVTYGVIGTQATLGAVFAQGKYMNTLDIFIKQGETLTLGLVLDGKYVDSNWCLFDNFKLEYMGNGAAPTAVEGITAKSNAPKAIYDLQGRRVQKAQKGIYIINGKKTIVK